MFNRFILVVSIALFAAAGLAHADNAVSNIEARCHSQYVADDGYEVTIERGPRGALLARLGQISLHGTQQIASLRVVRTEIAAPRSRQYVGRDLTLDIDLSGPAYRCGPNTRCMNSPFRAMISGDLVRNPQFSRLNCTVEGSTDFPRIPPRGGLTCMAFWSGAYFDAQTRTCHTSGMSGCSNPFEFDSIAACEDAFRTRQ